MTMARLAIVVGLVTGAMGCGASSGSTEVRVTPPAVAASTPVAEEAEDISQPEPLGAPRGPIVSRKSAHKVVEVSPAQDEEAGSSEASEIFSRMSQKILRLATDDTLSVAALEQVSSRILELEPRHSAARFNLAMVAQRRGDVTGAQAAYLELYREDGRFRQAGEQLGWLYLADGRAVDAVVIFRGLQGQLDASSKADTGLAMALYLSERFDEAIEQCRRVLRRQSDSIVGHQILAESLLALGKVEEAALVVRHGLEVTDGGAELEYVAGRVHRAKNNLREAVGALRRAIAKRPDHLPSRAGLGRLALVAGHFSEAARHYEALARIAPRDRQVSIGLAVAYRGLGRFVEAREVYDRLLERDPNDVDILWNLARLCHHHLSLYDEALMRYRQIRELNRTSSRAVLAELSGLIADAERLSVAAKEAGQQEALDAQRGQALEAACSALDKGQQPDLSGLGNDQDRINAAWDLMVAAQDDVQKGDWDSARRTMRCAFGVLPVSPTANVEACVPLRTMWAQLLQRSGDLSGALSSIDAALVCEPDNADAAQLRRDLLKAMKSN